MDIFQKLLQIEDETGGDVSNLRKLINSGQVTTASNINRPEPTARVKQINLFNDFNTRNPKAGGGRIGFKKNPLKNFNKKTNDPKKGIIKISEKSLEENIKEIKWLDKATNKEIVVYKTRILDRPKKIKGKQTAGKSGNYKTLFMEEYSTLKEAREARDNFREKNPKKFTPADSKKRPESKTKRRFFQSLEEGRQGSYKTPKGYVLHHMMPIGDAIPTKLNEYAVIDKYMNSALTKYDEKILKLVNEAYDLDFNNVKADSIKLDKINEKLFGVLKEIKKEMPKEYQGLLGFNKLTPVTDEYGTVFRYDAEPVGLDYKKSIAGKKQNIPVKSLEKKQVQKIVDEAPKIKNNLLKLAGQIDPDCRKKLVSGGRIDLKYGTDVCITKAKNYMNETLQKGIGTETNAKTSLIKRILSGTANFLKQNLSPKEIFKLENLIGKPALYGAAAFETGFVADDVLRKGKPLNVAAAESLFGDLLNLDADAARAKNLLESNVQLSPAAKEYAQNILDYDRYRKNELSFPASLIAKKMPGSDRYFKMQKDLKNKIENTPDTGAMDYMSALDESEGAFKAKPKFLDAPDKPEITPLTNKLAKSPGTRIGPMTAKQDMQIDLSLPTYDRSFTASDEFLNQYLKSIDQKPLEPGQGTLFRMNEPDQRGLYGTQERFAYGGLSGGDKSGRPPESGPMPQGLPGILKRVKKI